MFGAEFDEPEFGARTAGFISCLRDVLSVEQHKGTSKLRVLLAEQHKPMLLSPGAGLVGVFVDTETSLADSYLVNLVY